MRETLQPGLRHLQSVLVDERLTVPAVAEAFTGFSDMPLVFATAFMIGLIEWACIEALRPHLDTQERTVGTYVDVSHSAATPVGAIVTAEVELIEVHGRRLRFKVSCYDSVELVGQGFHERAVIDASKFMERVNAKGASSS